MNRSKLSKQEKEELLLSLVEAFSRIKNPKESAYFLRDLLSESEMEMLAIRLKIAKMTIEGSTYVEIIKNLKVSYTTVARVREWLKTQGEGFRNIIKRIKMEKK